MLFGLTNKKIPKFQLIPYHHAGCATNFSIMLPEPILKSYSWALTPLQAPRLQRSLIIVIAVLVIFIVYNAPAFHDRLELLGPNGKSPQRVACVIMNTIDKYQCGKSKKGK